MSWSDTAQVYKRRTPRESPLWQLFNDHFDEFEERYDDLFPRDYGFYRPVVSQYDFSQKVVAPSEELLGIE